MIVALVVFAILGIGFLGFNLVKNNQLKIKTGSEFLGYTLKLFNEMELRKYLSEVKIERGLDYGG